MYLKQLTLTNYKNIESKTFDFNPKINCFIGNNGVGKSNILDAIYHLALGKSYFNPISVQNIQTGNDFFVIKGLYEKNLREEKIVCSFKKGQKKKLLAKVIYKGPIEAPIKKDQIVAELKIIYDQDLVGKYNLLAIQEIKKVNIFSRLMKSLNYLIWGDV